MKHWLPAAQQFPNQVLKITKLTLEWKDTLQ